MNCPHCNKEITEVNAFFEHWQKIDIKTQTVKESETIFDETIDIECRNCNKSIKDTIDKNEEIYNIIMNA